MVWGSCGLFLEEESAAGARKTSFKGDGQGRRPHVSEGMFYALTKAEMNHHNYVIMHTTHRTNQVAQSADQHVSALDRNQVGNMVNKPIPFAVAICQIGMNFSLRWLDLIGSDYKNIKTLINEKLIVSHLYKVDGPTQPSRGPFLMTEKKSSGQATS